MQPFRGRVEGALSLSFSFNADDSMSAAVSDMCPAAN